jgi:hypothetical protein
MASSDDDDDHADVDVDDGALVGSTAVAVLDVVVAIVTTSMALLYNTSASA